MKVIYISMYILYDTDKYYNNKSNKICQSLGDKNRIYWINSNIQKIFRQSIKKKKYICMK